MKKILVYGDSNTWGDNFNTGIRIKDKYQWCNILSKKLGRNYQVIQEGLPGRIAGSNEVEDLYKNGKDTFMSILRTSSPVDIIIISLGTNDLQLKYNKSSIQVIEDLKWYQQTILKLYSEKSLKFFNNKLPDIYYLLPINFDYIDNMFDKTCEEKRQDIIKYFKDNKDYNSIISGSLPLSDGIHLSTLGHELLANIIYDNLIRE